MHRVASQCDDANTSHSTGNTFHIPNKSRRSIEKAMKILVTWAHLSRPRRLCPLSIPVRRRRTGTPVTWEVVLTGSRQRRPAAPQTPLISFVIAFQDGNRSPRHRSWPPWADSGIGSVTFVDSDSRAHQAPGKLTNVLW